MQSNFKHKDYHERNQSVSVKLTGYLIIVAVISVLIFSLFSLLKKLKFDSRVDDLNYAALHEAFDRKYSIDELKLMRPDVEDHLKYQAWTQFGNYDHANKYSIVENGVRKSSSSQSCVDNGPLVWFFGGSTMYGVGVPYWSTIPSFFSEIASAHGYCVRAVNYGVPYYYSFQEFIYFLNLIIKTKQTPDYVIFLDGINDFGQPGGAIKVEPFFTPVLEKVIPYGQFIRKSGNPVTELKDSLQILFSDATPKDTLSDFSNYQIPKDYLKMGKEKAIFQTANDISKNYYKLGILLYNICGQSKHTSCHRFLQPISVLQYSPTTEDPLTSDFRFSKDSQDRRKLVRIGYELIHKEYAASSKVSHERSLKPVELTDLFLGYEGLAYVDSAHYSPRASQVIAEKIFNNLKIEKPNPL